MRFWGWGVSCSLPQGVSLSAVRLLHSAALLPISAHGIEAVVFLDLDVGRR